MHHLTGRSPLRPTVAIAAVATLVLGMHPAAVAATLDDGDTTETLLADHDGEEDSTSDDDPVPTVVDTVDDTVEDPAGTLESAPTIVTDTVETLTGGADDDADSDGDTDPDTPSEGDDGSAGDNGSTPGSDPGTDADDTPATQTDRTAADDDEPGPDRATPRHRPLPPGQAPADAEGPFSRHPTTDRLGLPLPRMTNPLHLGQEQPTLDMDLLHGSTRDGDRVTDRILQLLRDAGAGPQTIARLLAPFPLAGPAAYQPTSALAVDLRSPAGTPVIAATNGVVEVTGSDRGVVVELVAADGARYRYDGLQHPADVVTGDQVATAQELGRVAAAGELRFSLWGPDGDALPAGPYLDRWLAEALDAARMLADSRGGAFTPQVASPDRPAPAPRAVAPTVPPEAIRESSFAPARGPRDGLPRRGLMLLGVLASALLAHRLLGSGGSVAAGAPEGFLDVRLDEPLR